MTRLLACFGGLLIGAFVGFFIAQFLAETLQSPSRAPSPYGDWRSTGAGLFFGAPMGAALGIFVGYVSTRQVATTGGNAFAWKLYSLIGVALGTATALVFYGNPILELCEGLGSLVGHKSIGIIFYFLFCGAAGASMLSILGLILNRFRKSAQ